MGRRASNEGVWCCQVSEGHLSQDADTSSQGSDQCSLLAVQSIYDHNQYKGKWRVTCSSASLTDAQMPATRQAVLPCATHMQMIVA